MQIDLADTLWPIIRGSLRGKAVSQPLPTAQIIPFPYDDRDDEKYYNNYYREE